MRKIYFMAVPEGGGVLEDDGTYDGILDIQEISRITVPAQSGVVVLRNPATDPKTITLPGGG